MPFFFNQNLTKLFKSDANLHLENYEKTYCILIFLDFVFFQRRVQQEAFFGGIFRQNAEPQHRSQRALNFIVNVHQS